MITIVWTKRNVVVDYTGERFIPPDIEDAMSWYHVGEIEPHYPVPAIIYEYDYDYPEAMYLDQVVVADEYGFNAITIRVWWYQ